MERLILIADGFTRAERRDRIIIAAEVGIRWIHLRDHEAEDETFKLKAENLKSLLPNEIKISVNARLEVADTLRLSFHAGLHGPDVRTARARLGPTVLIGVSTHDFDEIETARTRGADYVLFSPIFPTSSKPGHPGVGVEQLALACRMAGTLPVYALGGIAPERVKSCLDAGAHGIAVLSGILDAPDPAEAVRQYIRLTIFD